MLTKPQYLCLKDIATSRRKIYIQDRLFRIATYASLMSNGFIDIDMSNGNEGMVLKTEFTNSEYKRNVSLHAHKQSYFDVLADIKGV